MNRPVTPRENGVLPTYFAEFLTPFRRRFLRRAAILSLAGIFISYLAPLGATELVAPSPTASPSGSSESTSGTSSTDTSTTLSDTSTSTTSSGKSESSSCPEDSSSQQSSSEVDSSTVVAESDSSSVVTESECLTGGNSSESEGGGGGGGGAPVFVEPEPYALDPQPIIRIIAPSKLMVDPRARLRQVPPFQIIGSSNTLLCINGFGAAIDIGMKGVPEEMIFSSPNLAVSGDLSSYVRVFAQDSSWLGPIVGGSNGFWVQSGAGIANRALSISAVAVSRKTTDPELCSKAENSQLVVFDALGLSILTKKAIVPLKKR